MSLLISRVAVATEVIETQEQTYELSDYDEEPTFCRAVVILIDSRDGFKSEKDAFDWCLRRVNAWGLDNSKGWRDRFCSVSRHEFKDDYGDKFFRWNGRFRHSDAEFRSRYKGRIFYSIDQRYSPRIFRGTSLQLQINFNKDCSFRPG
jgi:hypothetical protein